MEEKNIPADRATIIELNEVLTRQQEQLRQLQREVGRLQSAVSGTASHSRDAAGTDQEPASTPIARRAILGKGAAVLAAGAGLAVARGATPAFAGTDGDLVLGQDNDALKRSTTLTSQSSEATIAFSNNQLGGGAVIATSLNGTGLQAVSKRGQAFAAEIYGPGNELDAAHCFTSGLGNALFGEVTNSGSKGSAVFGRSAGVGNAISGQITNTANTETAVLGINFGTGPCVQGLKPSGVAGDAVVGEAANGQGVVGTAHVGRGGMFSGSAAQVRLVPATAATHPTSGAAGDLFVDASKRLWFCKGTTMWVQVA